MRQLLIAIMSCMFICAASATDTVEYRTQLTLLPEDSALNAITTLEVPQQYLADGTVALFLNQKFEVTSVSGTGVESYAVEQSNKVPIWNEVIVKFSPTDKTTNERVTIEYSGTIDNNAQHGNFITPSQVHLSIDSAWHPVFSDFSTPIRGTVNIELSEDWTVFAPGQVSSDRSKHSVQSTSPTIDVSLYAEKNPNSISNGGFTVVHDESSAENAEFVLSAGLQCLQRMNQRFGSHAPLNSAQVILLKRPGPSFARGNHISLNSQNLGTKVHTHQYLCHEIAHNWTDFASAMSHDYWMIESFAEYISAKEVERIYGEEEFQKIVKQWNQRSEGEAFVWRPDTNRRATHKVNYGLGPIALMKLQEKVGKEAFAELIYWYMVHDVTETEDLIKRIETLSDSTIARWFSALLAGDYS